MKWMSSLALAMVLGLDLLAPPLDWCRNLPERDACGEFNDLAWRRLDWCRGQRSLWLHQQEYWDAAVADACWRRQVWALACECQCPFNTPGRRREYLAELRGLIGDGAFSLGVMPMPFPWEGEPWVKSVRKTRSIFLQ